MDLESKPRIDAIGPIALLVVAAVVMVGVLVWSAAVAQDDLGQQQAFAAVDRALTHELDQLALAAAAYAQQGQPSAAGSLANQVGPLTGIDLALLFDGADRASGWPVAGEPGRQHRVPEGSRRGLQALVDRARSARGLGPGATTGFVPLDDGIALVAAASSTGVRPDGSAPAAGPAAVVVLGRKLSGTFLEDLAGGLPLTDLRLASPTETSDRRARLTIHGPDGSRLGALIWRPDRPVHAFLERASPAVALLVLVIAAGVAPILRHAPRVAALGASRRSGGVADPSSNGTIDTAEVEAGRRADDLALHDPLTGLANRSLLNDRLEQVLAGASRRGDHAALLLVDMDRLEDVNATLGHPAGERLLQVCADRLSACVRECDTLARVGGDRFAVIQTAITRPADVSRVCERILKVFEQPFELEGHEVLSAVSIGCALVADDGASSETLLEKAAIALDRAKEDGRNTFRYFEPEMDARLQRQKTLEQDLGRAIAREQLELHLQPKIALGDNRLVGVEALVRWQHPIRGLIPPADFIGVAEESGLVVALGEWVLRETCRRGRAWPELHVAVNISPVQFRRSDLVGLVARTLAETGLPPARLELEITEGVLITQPAIAAEMLRALRALGVRIAVDDFGTGYSSLSYLHRFPFDKIKLDRSFISMLGKEAAADAVVRAVIGIARDLGMSTCAEGVETDRQLEMLVAEGCDEAQGYLFGRPMPVAALETFRLGWPETGQKLATAAA